MVTCEIQFFEIYDDSDDEDENHNGDDMDDDGDLAMCRGTVSAVHLLPLNLLSDPRIKFRSITVPNCSPKEFPKNNPGLKFLSRTLFQKIHSWEEKECDRGLLSISAAPSEQSDAQSFLFLLSDSPLDTFEYNITLRMKDTIHGNAILSDV